MVHIGIRAGVSDDLESLRDIYRRASLSIDGLRQALLAHPEVLELSGAGLVEGRTRVAVIGDGVIAGFITRLDLNPGTVEVEDLFVDPERMRRGVGRRLLDDLVSDARRRGMTSVEVTANAGALPFYRSAGFTPVRTVATRFGPATRMSRAIV